MEYDILNELMSFRDDFKDYIKNCSDSEFKFLKGLYSIDAVAILLFLDMESNINIIFPAAFNDTKRKIFISRTAKEADLRKFLDTLEDYIYQGEYYN